MRQVYEILSRIAPELEVEGEMHGDAALDENIRHLHSRIHASKVLPTC